MPVRKTIVDDKTFKNIELGAGCGNFGEKYYPKCIITDSDENIHTRCDKNHVHFICPASKTPFSDNRFQHVIMCNPWGYGFKEQEDADTLMSEIMRILISKGNLVLIFNETNKYCNTHKINKKLAEMPFLKGKCIITEELIDHKIVYPGYLFLQTLGIPASPNKKITINVTK